MKLMPLTRVTPRRVFAACALVVATAAVPVVVAPAASAHPLGNFTVNHHTGLTLSPDRVDARVVVDRAEISTAQEAPRIDLDANGSADAAEKRAYARAQCATASGELRVEAGGHRLHWAVGTATFSYLPGEGGLRTSRLQCTLTAPADLRRPTDVSVHTGYDSRRIGWREITARGRGVVVSESDVPAVSSTDELRHYPADPLASPLDQRSATLRTTPGGSGNTPLTPRVTTSGSGPVATALNALSGVFDSLVGARELTIPVGALALLLAIVLGASHAAMPGHGKTLMAAYLAGRRGTPKDAVTVGATVTLTHTAGVLVLGLLLPLATTLAGETVLTWLGVASGLLVTAIGLWLLRAAVRNKPTHPHGHTHRHPHGHGHEHTHHHPHQHDRPASPSTVDATAHATANRGPAVAVLTEERVPAPHPHTHHPAATRGGLIGMGIAGGLVPSPSALVVLLGAVALGRTAFGVLLVVGYGVGMAATLTLAGLLLVRLRDRIDRRARTTDAARWAGLRRLARYGPVATSGLVLLVGVGLTLRAAAGPW
ncbi:nickel transporter [Streptomyces sp. NPDC088725]|uniref:HoxN/HupN/NixA family nickel/cobalt transporter n=1 Tax=Streptomyces sp. NPDC088725 TaxID=3365873 RepID=UPI0037F16754